MPAENRHGALESGESCTILPNPDSCSVLIGFPEIRGWKLQALPSILQMSLIQNLKGQGGLTNQVGTTLKVDQDPSLPSTVTSFSLAVFRAFFTFQLSFVHTTELFFQVAVLS